MLKLLSLILTLTLLNIAAIAKPVLVYDGMTFMDAKAAVIKPDVKGILEREAFPKALRRPLVRNARCLPFGRRWPSHEGRRPHAEPG